MSNLPMGIISARVKSFLLGFRGGVFKEIRLWHRGPEIKMMLET